jgi:hypothetical protein
MATNKLIVLEFCLLSVYFCYHIRYENKKVKLTVIFKMFLKVLMILKNINQFLNKRIFNSNEKLVKCLEEIMKIKIS